MMIRMSAPILFLTRLCSVSCVMLVLCGSPAKASAAEIPRANILMVDKDGGIIDPEAFVPLAREEYGRYVENIFRGLAAHCASQKLKQREKPCKMLLYFHGGLNSRTSSVDRASKLTPRIQAEGTYPVFVNWRSSLPSSWWDHVAHVRSGFWVGNKGILAAPYIIVADEAKAVAEAPMAWWAEIRHTFPPHQEAGRLALLTYEEMVRNQQGSPNRVTVNNLLDSNRDPSRGPRLLDKRTQGERWLPRGTLILTSWSKVLGAPLVVQAGGTGAWDIMQRRTAMLFRTEAEFRNVPPEAMKEKRTGQDVASPEQQTVVELARQYDTGAALAYFISRFQREFLPQFCRRGTYSPLPSPEQEEPKSHEEGAVQRRDSCPDLLEVSLVGHSMGTIIIDRLLRYSPNLEVKNIVFMGSATSVEDYRDTVDSYLDRHKSQVNGGKGTQMYHLVLHPLAEVTERNFLDLAPRGSLLVWIDNYFTEPTTPLGRRVGRFSNVVPELRFAADGIRDQVHLKVFRLERKYRCWNPRKHSDFGGFPFWDEDFWNPETATDETSPVQRLSGAGCPKQVEPENE